MPVHHVVHHLALNLFFPLAHVFFAAPLRVCSRLCILFSRSGIQRKQLFLSHGEFISPQSRCCFFFPIYRIFSPLYLAFNSWNELTIVP